MPAFFDIPSDIWRIPYPVPRPEPATARPLLRAPIPPTPRAARSRLILPPPNKRPPPELVARFREPMRRLVLVWRDVSRTVPVELTSWWRSAARNAETRGAAAYSQHLVGTAIDGQAQDPSISRAELLPIVQRAGARYGVSVPSAPSEASGRSVHAQALPVGAVRTMALRDPTLLARR
jgi:hypothetical protein